MSRLPQPGDAVKAARVLNERTNAAVGIERGDEMVTTGPLVITPDGVTGEGLSALLAVYGDLFEVNETLNDAGIARLIGNHEQDVESGVESLPSALVAIGLQGIAFGVLMERLRWERS